MNRHDITDAQYAAALAAGRVEAETEIRAESVSDLADRDLIEIVTTRRARFLIPRAWIGALQDVPVEDIAKLHVWPDGLAIEIEELDIHVSVDGLMAAILPAMLRPEHLPPSSRVAADKQRRTRNATARERTGAREVVRERPETLSSSRDGRDSVPSTNAKSTRRLYLTSATVRARDWPRSGPARRESDGMAIHDGRRAHARLGLP